MEPWIGEGAADEVEEATEEEKEGGADCICAYPCPCACAAAALEAASVGVVEVDAAAEWLRTCCILDSRCMASRWWGLGDSESGW